MKSIRKLIAVVLCMSMMLTLTGFRTVQAADGSTVGISSVMSRRADYHVQDTNETQTEDDAENADTEEGEPYQSLQWAIYNDGSFSVNDTDNSGHDMNDGGMYDGGGFTIPDVVTNPGETQNDWYNENDRWSDIEKWYNDWMDSVRQPMNGSWNGGRNQNGGWSGSWSRNQDGSWSGSFTWTGGWSGSNSGYNGASCYYGSGMDEIGSLINSYFGDCCSWVYGMSGNRYGQWILQTEQTAAVEGIDTDALKAWELASGDGEEVIVAIIDTGADYMHEDLAGSIWVNTGEIADNGIDDDNNGYIDDVYGWNFYNDNAKVYSSRRSDEYDHGTHVAGIIAAAQNDIGIAGLASNANVKIMLLKALGGSDGEGDTADVISAIEYAEAMGASVCNLSFGTTENDKELARVIKNSNMLFICAAGNGDSRGYGVDTDSTPLYPAAYDFDNIISVANLSCDGTLDSSTNYGLTSVDIAAPGTDILSTTTEDSYEYLSGTSMAAPMVTAVAAMVYSYGGNLTAQEARALILSGAEKLDSLNEKVATGGMLNAYDSLKAAIENAED